MLPIKLGANRIAAQDEIFFICSFCVTPASVACWEARVAESESALASRALKDATRSAKRMAWSCTSMNFLSSSTASSGAKIREFDVLAQPLDHRIERGDGPLEFNDFPGQFIDAPGNIALAGKQLFLDLVDVDAQTRCNRFIFIDDLVDHRIENGFGPHGQELPFVFHAFADFPDLG